MTYRDQKPTRGRWFAFGPEEDALQGHVWYPLLLPTIFTDLADPFLFGKVQLALFRESFDHKVFFQIIFKYCVLSELILRSFFLDCFFKEGGKSKNFCHQKTHLVILEFRNKAVLQGFVPPHASLINRSGSPSHFPSEKPKFCLKTF